MEIVTAAELAKYFEKLTEQMERLGSRVATVVSGHGVREYFTREEAAEYLRVSPRSVDRLAASGRLLRVKFGDHDKSRVRFRRQDLDAFVESCLERV